LKKNLITAIILTYNEEIHIDRCIKSISKFVDEIFIIDSFSNDKTIKKARKYKKVKIFKRKFIHQADQMNWALKNLKFKTDWILRIDADEYINKPKKNLFTNKLNEKNINGYIITRKIKFLGKIINYGATSPHKTLRLWRTGKAHYPNVSMDEQAVVKGRIAILDILIIDDNLKGLLYWVKKHINYSIREANEYLKLNEKNYKYDDSKTNKLQKNQIYYNFPIFIRPFLLFIYSYFFKLGFLTGLRGFVFYFFQNLLYRLLVDINIFLKKFK
jgi:glycosyltransferase involved in cell wall biosynthesis